MPKVKTTPKNLYETRNTSDVFSRSVIMGILRILNLQLTYTQVWDDSESGIQKVTVPFFFDFSGGSNVSEKFIQDNYMNWTDDECTSMGIKKINGDYKPIPYGVISLDSTNIESSNISNRFVLGKYQKKIDDEFKSYVAFLYSIPLTMSFNVNIVCDTINTMWKIEQAYREFFYKNKTFRFNYRGTVCPARVGFPESITETKTMQYQMGNAASDGFDIKLSFSLLCETYQPVFDPYSEMAAENYINGANNNILVNNKDGQSAVIETGHINAITNLNDAYIVTMQDVLLEWEFIYDNSDLTTVDILYKEEDSDEYIILESNVENHNCYYLQFNEDFIDSTVLLDIIVENVENMVIINQPKIKFFADPETNIIDNGTCVVIDKGFIMTDKESLDAMINYYDDKGQIKEKALKLNILNNAIDEDNPVDLEPFVYKADTINYKKVKLFVRDHNNPGIIAAFQDENEWVYIL